MTSKLGSGRETWSSTTFSIVMLTEGSGNAMFFVVQSLEPSISKYKDRHFPGSQEEFEECLRTSTTVYVGNLSFYTTEEQIHEVFSRCGELKRIVMGLDSVRKVPCGFCFVVYYTREDTEDCVKYLNGTVLDDRSIRVDFDWGFEEGRQYGRGRSGGQVRDEFRVDYDAGRGGYGHWLQQEVQAREGQDRLPEGDVPPSGMERDQGMEEQLPDAKRARP